MAIGFAAGVKNSREKYEARMLLLHKKVSIDMFRRNIMKTPVDTGRARGNWMLGINTIPMAELLETEKGSATVQKIITGLEGLKLGDNTALANSVPYIGVLEYGGYPKDVKYGSAGRKSNRKKGITAMRQIKSVGGYSAQAPNGMVRITVEEYRPTLNKAIALVKREIP